MGPYFGAFLGLGVALSFFGPALPTLRDQTGSSLGEIGLVFGAQSLGGLVGSLVAGRLYRRFGGPHLISLAVVALAAGLAGIPLAASLAAVIVLGTLIGLGAGTLDVSANTLTPTLVPAERLVSSMNALHLCFAIGALATPVLVFASTESSGGLGPACGVFAAALAALGLFVWRRDRADGARRAAADHEAAGAPPEAWRLGFVAAFFLLYVGLEVCFAGWIATYAHEIGLGGGWATALTAMFWAGFLAGRLTMTWRGDRVRTGPLLRASVGAATLIAVFIALVGGHAIPVLLASGLLGAVIAPQFPTMLTHLHQVIPLTGTVTAWCIAGAAVGGLLLPPAIGGLFDAVGAGALPWTVAAASLASAAVLVGIDRWALAPGAGATLR